jgi:hypothetical protein
VAKRKRLIVEREEGITSYKLSKMIAELRGFPGVVKAVWRTMADRYPNIWASIATFSYDSGFSEQSVRRAIRTGESIGILRALGDKRGGRQNTEQYVFDVDCMRTLLETQPQRKGFSGLNPATQDGLSLPERNPFVRNPTTQEINPSTVVEEQRSNREVGLNRESEQRRQISPPFSNPTPKPSDKENQQPTAKKIAAIEKLAKEANPNAIVAEEHWQSLADAFPGVSNVLTGITGPIRDGIVRQAVHSRVRMMDESELVNAGKLIAEYLVLDLERQLSTSGQGAAQ